MGLKPPRGKIQKPSYQKTFREMAEQRDAILKNFFTNNQFSNIAKKSINSEMDISSFLTKWPCPSLKDLEIASSQSGITLPISYRSLSANCSESYIRCTIQLDLNEQ